MKKSQKKILSELNQKDDDKLSPEMASSEFDSMTKAILQVSPAIKQKKQSLKQK